MAAWLNIGEKPRPSSFIPAPPRAEAPSLVAAPPASSDRLIRADDLAAATEPGIRTYPVRIDIEMGGGKIYVGVNPEQLSIHAGEGIEWDFRYVNGSDVVVDEIAIEFTKPSPFPKTIFKSQKPGSARPHRQFSGPATVSAGQLQYFVRCLNVFKTEIATAKPFVTIS